MTFENVKSKNPVKRPVMEALKKLTGGQKVTNVQESNDSFRANVFKHLGNRKYEALGNHTVTKEQLTSMGLFPLTDEAVVTDEVTATQESMDTTTEQSNVQSSSLFD